MAASGSTIRLSIICFLLGVLVPILHSLYSQGVLTVPAPLEDVFKRYTSRNSEPAIPQTQVTPLSERHTVRTSQNWSAALHTKFAQDVSARLANALRRDNGKWDVNHPRRRILEGLRGYQLYGEGRRAELDGWRTKFKRLPRNQRAVCLNRL